MDLWSIGGGGWGQSVMKLIWCSGLTWIYGQLEEGVSLSWKLFGVMVFQRSMLNWLGGLLARVGLSAKFELIYVSCFGEVVLHWSMVNWRRGGGQSVMKIIWCNGLPEIHAWLTRGSISQSRFLCQIWAHLCFMLCFTEGLFILHTKDWTM